MKRIINIVEAYIEKHRLLSPSDRVLVALSGGADSVCLLLLLHDMGYEVEAAHCNFHLRGEESMRDEAFVAQLCENKGIVLHRTDFDTASYAKAKGISIEMAARDLRYEWFAKVMREGGLTALAVGHHQADNAETMLLNMVRGTGIQGMCGIMPSNDRGVVRPLLCLSRKDITDCLERIGQDYVTDSTNLKDDVSRNKIRLDIMPLLEQINPSALQSINTTIDNMNEVRKVYEAAIKADRERCCTWKDGCMHIEWDVLSGCASPISVLHSVMSEHGFNRTQIVEMLEGGQGRVWMASEWRALWDRGRIVLAPNAHADAASVSMTYVDAQGLVINKDKRYAYIDADKVKGEVKVRRAEEGDSFQPFGMRGRKLLSDFLTNLKKSRFEKEAQMVVCDDEDILWVVGERSSERYRVDKDTRRVLMLCQES